MKLPAIAPSLMCMDLLEFRNQIQFLNDKVAWFHVDIMDGHFVPNLTLSPWFVSSLSQLAKAPIDCHLMVTDPENYVAPLAKAGATMVSFHAEAVNGKAFRLIDTIRQVGMQCGLVLNPETQLEDVTLYLARIDKVTIMTVDPGFAGQVFIPEMLGKIKAFASWREQHGLNYLIEVDGSCNKNTYASLMAAGADILIMGSSGLFNHAPEIAAAWQMMQSDLQEALAPV
ncbi:D-allulose 6-phosphate 3-epimerase [Raoultella sp. BIGb0138]|uniref:D-allulose 6-phosphate 3-epimerase n=1 Tax=Raoultella sp. BIGb0138 TaxID=2485115 RepID=UPI00104E4953|nr:D-allulose 6-phosphate 3-epimerase [Raoultella sp. BIGb0138]TCW17989.1 D-allulose 6-phosphate 3-epimerase [Raoultella sp. BIGb0138]